MIKKIGLILVSALSLSVTFAQTKNQSFVPEIDIKGIKFNLRQGDVEAIVGSFIKPKDFTIGGVYPSDIEYAPFVRYINGELSLFQFMFDSVNFNQMREAVASKYPSLQCEQSEIKNRMNASFQQVKCKLNSPSGILEMSKYADNVVKGHLTMTSYAEINKVVKRVVTLASAPVGDSNVSAFLY